MPRPLRINCSGIFYHVLSRGNERRAIFRDRRDYEKLLENLGEMVSRFDLEIHAFVLMPNHYHLLIRTNLPNLSDAMQWFGGKYAVWFNRRHERSGHLFQGRFKSFVIEDDRYFVAMGLYIHRNPVRAGIVNDPSEYPWSSYAAYHSTSNRPRWLTKSLLLGVYGNSRRDLISAHSYFAQEGREDTLLDSLRDGAFLGSEGGFETWSAQMRGHVGKRRFSFRSADARETIHEILEKIRISFGGESPEKFLKPVRRKRRPHRDLTLYVLNTLDRFSQEEMGLVFGVGRTAVSQALQRAEKLLQCDEEARRWIEKVIKSLN